MPDFSIVTDKLTKKVGPLPVWVWGAAALVILYAVYKRRQTPTDVSPVAISPPDEGMITGDNGTSFEGLTGGGVGNIGGGTGPVYQDPGPSYDPGFYPSPPVNDYSPVFEPAPPVYEPAPGPSVITAPTIKTQAIGPTKQTSFVWSGVTYRKGDLAKFRAALKKSGVAYSTWAKNHPKAAQDVFGTMN